MGCDANMTARRIALWWRLLLVAGVLALPVVSATATPVVAATTHQAPVVHAVVAPSAAAPTAQIHHSRHAHRTAPMLAAVAVAGVVLVVLLVSTGVARRRISQLLGDTRHWWSSRAPPNRTSFLVPFGLAPGSAGRFSRSPFALVTCTTPTSC
jgi:hypothetical protein